MTRPFAEVIGDPVSHSKSPRIHGFWLDKLGIPADYRATQVAPAELKAFIKSRMGDPAWRGCNVTAPHKPAVAHLVGDPVGVCASLAAVNTVLRSPLGCVIGTNTDVDGLAEALAGVEIAGATVILVGAGGAARAALCFLVSRHAERVVVVARDIAKAMRLRDLVPADATTIVEVAVFGTAAATTEGSSLVINATPLGMSGRGADGGDLLESLGGIGAGATAFDMVYDPIDTPFLRAARASGADTANGLTMLIGQAAPAFELFFGVPAPREHDAELWALLTA